MAVRVRALASAGTCCHSRHLTCSGVSHWCCSWVVSARCTSPGFLTSRRYNHSQSSASHAVDGTFAIWYGSGAVQGEYVADTVSLGSLTIPDQVFAEALTGQLSDGFAADGACLTGLVCVLPGLVCVFSGLVCVSHWASVRVSLG